ncbi:SRPBCC domain-containing protein [Streptomyces boninensis]|uniref:SRPBCC domain-containing protein n=1 Tax=Streptomyces boninensis TaxID=2039455 RepID=UPI003B226325
MGPGQDHRRGPRAAARAGLQRVSSPPPSAAASDQSDPDPLVVRVLDAPRSLVHAALTDPDHVAAWLAPEGFETPRDTVTVEPWIGGRYDYCLVQAVDGSRFWMRNRIAELAVPRLLVLTSEPMPAHGVPEPITTRIALDDIDGGGRSRTQLTLTRGHAGGGQKLREEVFLADAAVHVQQARDEGREERDDHAPHEAGDEEEQGQGDPDGGGVVGGRAGDAADDLQGCREDVGRRLRDEARQQQEAEGAPPGAADQGRRAAQGRRRALVFDDRDGRGECEAHPEPGQCGRQAQRHQDGERDGSGDRAAASVVEGDPRRRQDGGRGDEGDQCQQAGQEHHPDDRPGPGAGPAPGLAQGETAADHCFFEGGVGQRGLGAREEQRDEEEDQPGAAQDEDHRCDVRAGGVPVVVVVEDVAEGVGRGQPADEREDAGQEDGQAEEGAGHGGVRAPAAGEGGEGAAEDVTEAEALRVEADDAGLRGEGRERGVRAGGVGAAVAVRRWPLAWLAVLWAPARVLRHRSLLCSRPRLISGTPYLAPLCAGMPSWRNVPGEPP